MFRDIFMNRWVISSILLLIIVIGGCILWYHHTTADYAKQAAEVAELVRQQEGEKVKTEAAKVGTAPTKKTLDININVDNPTTFTGKSITPEGSAPLQTSSNPMFASGVPAHLACPDEWIGIYFTDYQGDISELKRTMWARIDEILSEYNPQRPLTEVWPLFIASEKSYMSQVDSQRLNIGESQDRLDWMYQTYLDFPEIFVLSQVILDSDQNELLRDTEHFDTMRMVEMGHLDPNVNLHILQDGREFRARTGYNYEEKLITMSPDYTSGFMVKIGFGHSVKTAPIIEIDLMETSDEELEQLSGWNYNINPYIEGMYILPINATERVLKRNRSIYGE